MSKNIGDKFIEKENLKLKKSELRPLLLQPLKKLKKKESPKRRE